MHLDLFPFSKIRDGQKQFLERTRFCIANKKCLIAHAPTGIGKTAASLAPALEDALGNGRTVIFLTPRHSQHKIVIDTLRAIAKKSGAKIRVADIIGKRWLCNVPDISDLSQGDFDAYCKALKKEEKCQFWNNTWQKTGGPTDVAKAVLERIENEIMHAEEVKALCKGLCPADIFVEAARNSDVIVADYFHIFHPEIQKMFLRKTGKSLEDSILIVDEAHNVPGRVRGLLSSQLSSFQLDRAISEAQAFGYYDISDELKDVDGLLLKVLKEAFAKTNKCEAFIKKEKFVEAVEKIRDYGEFIEDLETAAEKVRDERKKSFIGGIAHFLESWRGKDAGFARIIRKIPEHRGQFVICYECLDPQIATKDTFAHAHSAIIMSGTMNPVEMYEELFGMDAARTERLILKSPFPQENRLCIVMNDVTTRFTKRSEEGLMKIAGSLVKIINKSRGNVGVFFPSYGLRDNIYVYIERSLLKQALLERQNMTKEEKSGVYNAFVDAAGRGRGAALLGVIGGNFNEGIDFPGEIMNVVVIVGLPLERPDLLTEALINYYDFKFNRGWDYGYSYPAITKAVQTAGRPIRSETDRAMVIFMDERYLWQNYRKVLPQDMELVVSRDIGKEVEEFFSGAKKAENVAQAE